MKEVKIKKGQIIQRKGDLNSKVYQVESGLLRSYSIDQKGKEYIYMFAPENWIVADTVSPESPCELFIDALEDSIVIQIEKDLTTITDNQKLIKRIEVLQKESLCL